MNEQLDTQIHLFLLNIKKQLQDEHSANYYQWLRHLITLAAGVLAALVSFQNTYIPSDPNATWLLQCCWLFLSGSIILGQLALYGQIQAPFEAAIRVADVLKKNSEKKNEAFAVAAFQGISVSPKKLYHYAYLASVVLFALALFLLALFGGLNIPEPNFPQK